MLTDVLDLKQESGSEKTQNEPFYCMSLTLMMKTSRTVSTVDGCSKRGRQPRSREVHCNSLVVHRGAVGLYTVCNSRKQMFGNPVTLCFTHLISR